MLTYYYGHCATPSLAFKRQLNYNYPTVEGKTNDWITIGDAFNLPSDISSFLSQSFPREAIKKISSFSVSMTVHEKKVGIILGIDNCKRDPSSSLFTLINLFSLYFLTIFPSPLLPQIIKRYTSLFTVVATLKF